MTKMKANARRVKNLRKLILFGLTCFSMSQRNHIQPGNKVNNGDNDDNRLSHIHMHHVKQRRLIFERKIKADNSCDIKTINN